MTLENQKNKEGKGVSKYLITGVSENSVNPKYVELMDELFATMAKGEKTNNAQLVAYIEDKMGQELNSDIKTDIPLFGSKKCAAVESGLVIRAKEGRIWTYTKQ